MTNTRIIYQDFEVLEPTTLQELLHLLERHGQEARMIAGGTDLLVQIKLEACFPNFVIGIRRIPELNILVDGYEPRIGAALTLSDVLTFLSGKKKYAALSEALGALGTVPIRNMGTIGGNLCNASPSADTAPPLLVFDAHLKVRSLKGERTLPLTDFFVDVNRTAIGCNEVLTEICFPRVSENAGTSFLKISRIGAGISKVNAAVFMEQDRGVCTTCRIALGSVASVPMRVYAAEEAIRGKRVGFELFEEAAKIAGEEIKPITDVRSTVTYRRTVAAAIVRDALAKAWQRTQAR
jgi:carbon-monoxide dehydrogenase medium subunit